MKRSNPILTRQLANEARPFVGTECIMTQDIDLYTGVQLAFENAYCDMGEVGLID